MVIDFVPGRYIFNAAKFIVVSLLILANSNLKAQEIRYRGLDEYIIPDNLSWKDYQAQKPEGSNALAITTIKVSGMHYNTNPDGSQIPGLEVVFYRTRSWVDKKKFAYMSAKSLTNLFDHEKHTYLLYIVFAKRIIRKIQSEKIKDVRKMFDRVDQLETEQGSELGKYFKETDKGQAFEKQKEWDKKIDAEYLKLITTKLLMEK